MFVGHFVLENWIDSTLNTQTHRRTEYLCIKYTLSTQHLERKNLHLQVVLGCIVQLQGSWIYLALNLRRSDLQFLVTLQKFSSNRIAQAYLSRSLTFLPIIYFFQNKKKTSSLSLSLSLARLGTSKLPHTKKEMHGYKPQRVRSWPVYSHARAARTRYCTQSNTENKLWWLMIKRKSKSRTLSFKTSPPKYMHVLGT